MFKDQIAELLSDKVILVTGGTGSFGEYLVRELLTLQPKKVIIFSRDEQKQFQLKHKLEDEGELLEFIIGDVRDYDSLSRALRGVDVVFHAAAMKHVPICEENPMEAVLTNVYGAYNLREAAIQNGVKKVIAISTDKAVRSVNVMGMSKAIQERILLSDSKTKGTVFVAVRFGNVVGSRGSVIPLFVERIKNKKSVPLTDPGMTRFLITLSDAMELIFTAAVQGKRREIFVKKMPVCQISELAEVMIEELAPDGSSEIKITGTRQGEQLYESLISEEEMRRTEESESYFIIYPYGIKDLPRVKTEFPEYRTNLTSKRMSKGEIKELLKKTGWL